LLRDKSSSIKFVFHAFELISLRTIPIEATGEAEKIRSFGEPLELAGKAPVIEIYEVGHFGRNVCA
jgi:hypothetical protein